MIVMKGARSAQFKQEYNTHSKNNEDLCNFEFPSKLCVVRIQSAES